MTLTRLESDHAEAHSSVRSRPCGRIATAVALACTVAVPSAFAQSSQPDTQAGAPAADPTSPAIHAGPVTLTFGGFTELAVFYRDKTQTADVGSNFNTAIPFASSPLSDISELRFSARQSRFSFLAQGDPYAGAKAESYMETDFLGAAPTANSQESNSYNLRIRVFYGRFITDSGFQLTAGQSWSLATLYKQGLDPRQENVPLTIDAQYVAGFNWLRVPELRLVQHFAHVFSLGLALDSPQALLGTNNTVPTTTQLIPGDPKGLTTSYVTLNPYPATAIYQNAGGSLFAPTNNYSVDPAPDVILKAALDPGFGHYEVYGLARWFRSNLAGNNDTVSGGGIGAGLILPIIPGNLLNFQASGLYGKGVGRYGSSQLPDVTVEPTGALSTNRESSVLFGLTFTPMPQLTAYAYAGREQMDQNWFTATITASGGVFGPYGYGYGNPLFVVSGCYTLGGKCQASTASVSDLTAGFWWKYYQGVLGNLQFGLQAEVLERKSFAGVGGAPAANIFIGMASFRYYPFQH